jgi:hypothetical protein
MLLLKNRSNDTNNSSFQIKELQLLDLFFNEINYLMVPFVIKSLLKKKSGIKAYFKFTSLYE